MGRPQAPLPRGLPPAPPVSSRELREPARGWGYWTVVLPCLLTLPWAFLILLVDLASTGLSEGVTGPGPAPGQAVSIYENGQLIAVLAAAALLIAALFLARWRRVFALSAWCVIVWEIGWFFLLVHLEQIR